MTIDLMEQVIEVPDHTLRAIDYLNRVARLIGEKGIMYGDSLSSRFAGSLSGVDGPAGILARIEDKLGRYANLRAKGIEDDEDTIADIIGYFALLATWEDPDGDDGQDNVIDIAPFLLAARRNGTH